MRKLSLRGSKFLLKATYLGMERRGTQPQWDWVQEYIKKVSWMGYLA